MNFNQCVGKCVLECVLLAFLKLFSPFPKQIFGYRKQNEIKVTTLKLKVKTKNGNRKMFSQIKKFLKLRNRHKFLSERM